MYPCLTWRSTDVRANDSFDPMKYDWDKLKREFIGAGRETLQAFAKRKGMTYRAIRRIAGKERWVKTRRFIQGGATTDEGVALCDCCRKSIQVSSW